MFGCVSTYRGSLSESKNDLDGTCSISDTFDYSLFNTSCYLCLGQ